MSKSAYINTVPENIGFTLPFSDKSGTRLSVIFAGLKTDVSITDCGNSILVAVEDIDWLIDALRDVKAIHKMDKIEPKQPGEK
jgi:hypothetical protein